MTQSNELNENVMKVTSMTVDEFQTACMQKGVAASVIDDMVYDLALALMKSNKNTFIDINKTGGKW